MPPLENGDRLDRFEFERRYNAMPDNVRAELIDGVVYMASPVRQGKHGLQFSNLNWFLGAYRVATPGIQTGGNVTVRLGPKNEPQPDGMLRILETAGGHSALDDEEYLIGAPELLGEITASTVSLDLGQKKEIYRKFGVMEYIAWRVLDEEIDWFILRNQKYEPLQPNDDGVIKSEVFPGLWLNVAAMLQDDVVAVQQTLQKGLASLEHKNFAAQLAARMGTTK